MRIAFISDIHANLPALEAVLADIATRTDLQATYHLGDLVGYAPWPNEVVSLLEQRRIQGIAGNYDSTVATDYKHCGCQYEDAEQERLSHLSYGWTRSNVNANTRLALVSLPFRLDVRPLGGHAAGPAILLLHGNNVLNTVYVTEDRPDAFLERIGTGVAAKAGDFVCMGHTHLSWHREVGGVHYVNTGSVGRPKDGDPRAEYVLIGIGDDPPVEFVRVEYDVERAMAAIRASELPDEFADHLRTGGKTRNSESPRPRRGADTQS